MQHEPQVADAVLMVRPAAFGFNAEAARSNAFASALADPEVQSKVLAEFDGLAGALTDAGVEVLVLEDSADPPKPDAVFPNNWMSFHSDATAILYPLSSAARRAERRAEDVRALLSGAGFRLDRWIDLTPLEAQGAFLESTGSLVLDRPNTTAYACLSPRTHPAALDAFETATGYRTHRFTARDRASVPAYHTNVVMSLGARCAAVALEMVDEAERESLRDALEASGRTVIEISREQVSEFAANILELRTRGGGSAVAMSRRALASLTSTQQGEMERLAGRIVSAPIPTIETVGGGGVRCMLAEVFLPKS